MCITTVCIISLNGFGSTFEGVVIAVASLDAPSVFFLFDHSLARSTLW
jgi:hypothetical protein